MGLIIDLLLVIIIVCLILIWYVATYNKFQTYVIRINEAETNIDATLRKRFDLLNKSIGIIKASVELDEKTEVLEIITKLRSKKLTNFDLDRQLYEAINEFHVYKEKYDVLTTNSSFIKIDNALLESEAEIDAGRKYYNDIITDFNKMVKSFPSNLVALTLKYKVKTYYDGKDMTDDIKNDFKL